MSCISGQRHSRTRCACRSGYPRWRLDITLRKLSYLPLEIDRPPFCDCLHLFCSPKQFNQSLKGVTSVSRGGDRTSLLCMITSFVLFTKLLIVCGKCHTDKLAGAERIRVNGCESSVSQIITSFSSI